MSFAAQMHFSLLLHFMCSDKQKNYLLHNFISFCCMPFGRNKLYLKMQKVNQKPKFSNLNFN